MYKQSYNNIDKWGWAVTFAPLLNIPRMSWLSNEDHKTPQIGISKLIYYLFTDGAIVLDPKKMIDFVI